MPIISRKGSHMKILFLATRVVTDLAPAVVRPTAAREMALR